MRSGFVLAVIALCMSVSCMKQQDYYFYDSATMQANRKAIRDGAHNPAYERLIAAADSIMDLKPWTVTAKETLPPSGDKHDYMSQGPYWWPNPDTPDGLPYIRRDGQTNPEIKQLKDATWQNNMTSAVEQLALAYYFSGEEKYAAKAVEFIRVWFLDEDTRMNPNLNYGQRIPGICEGRDIGIIDSKCYISFLQGVQLLEESRNWTKADDKGLKAWFREYRDWLLTSKNGIGENTQPNNHGTSYDLQVSMFSLYCDDIQPAVRHMNDTTFFRYDQIAADGSQPREMARTKSWSYSIMNLRLLTMLAMIDGRLGNDYWNYVNANGASLKDAYEYFFEVIRNEREWPGRNIDHVEFPMGGLAQCIAMAAGHYDKEYFWSMLEKVISYNGRSIDPYEAVWSLTYPLPER